MRLNYGEWRPDAPSLEAPLLEALNVMPYGDHYRPFLGSAAISSALPDAPFAAISSSVENDVSETYAATFDKLYRLSVATWLDVTGAAVVTSTSMVWSFAQFDRFIIAGSPTNLLRFVTIGTPGNFTTIANSPQARVLGTVRDFLFCGDISDPTDGLINYRVRWSAIGDSLNWPLAGTAGAQAVQSDEQDLKSENGAVRAIFATDVGVIFQERAITRATYVGAPLIFQFDTIDNSRGLVSRRAGVQMGRSIYFLAEDGFFVTDGSGESQPIGSGKVDRYFYENLNELQMANIQAIGYPVQKCVAWFYAAGGSNINNAVIIYNYRDQKWAHGLIDTALVINARTAGYTLEQLDQFGNMDTLAASLDSPVWQGGISFPASIGTDFRFGSLSGPALTAVFETGDLALDGRRSYINGVRPLNEGGSTLVTLGTKKLITDAITWGPERAVTPATGKADFRSSAFYQRIRSRIVGGFTKALGVDAVFSADQGGQ